MKHNKSTAFLEALSVAVLVRVCARRQNFPARETKMSKTDNVQGTQGLQRAGDRSDNLGKDTVVHWR